MMRIVSPLRIGQALLAAALLLVIGARAGAQCAGDCDGNGAVAINELVLGVNIALGSAQVSSCLPIDTNSSGTVEINELVAAVNRALGGCPAGGTPTATVSAPLATPTATPTTNGGTPTFTPTVPASCGNGSIDFSAGETCDDGNNEEGPGDSCPANCRVAQCTNSGEAAIADVLFNTDPGDLLIAGMTLFVRYPDGVVDVPGVNNDAAVQAAITSDFFGITPNDTNYSLTTVLIDPFLSGVGAGTAISVDLIGCAGAGEPSEGDFECRVIDATDANGAVVTDQVSCTVTLR
jgi:hypothetical protein